MRLPSLLAALLLSLPLVAQKPVDYATEIQPVLKQRCYSCHGPRRQKGDLRLDLKSEVFKGDKSKWSILPGDGAGSEVYKRIILPEDHDDVMPAKGKLLTKDEQQLVKRWIDEGASWPGEDVVADEKKDEPLAVGPLDDAAKAAEAKALQTIKEAGGLAQKVAANSEAVDVNLSLMGTKATDGAIAWLSGLEPSLVWMNLSRTSVTDSGVAGLSAFSELRRLNLSNTSVGDRALESLSGLKKLEYLNLYGTKVTDAGLANLSSLTGLRRLYLWQTETSEEASSALAAKIPGLVINRGASLATVKEVVEKAPVNKVCPVSGKPVDAAQTSEHDGQLIAFCCKDCKAKFDADPTPFLAKIKEVAAKTPVNTLCPVSGKPVDAAATSEHNGQLVAFCCNNCKAKFDANPSAFVAKITGLKK